MPKKTVRVLATYKAELGKVEELRQFLNQSVAPALKRAGCLHHSLQQSSYNSHEFNFTEEWESQVVFKILQNAHLQEGLDNIGEFISVGPDFRR